jgi:1-acyl-sn-glycerol-3-phosphate acyltransferase
MLLRYDLDSLDNRDDALIARLVGLVERVLVPYFRATVRGVERVPHGAGLFVANHNGALATPDTFILGAALHRAHGVAGVPFGLGHEVALKIPGIHHILVPLGAVRATHDNALGLFARGDKVLVYPGGDVDAMRPYRHRNRIVFGGRTGYVRLALRAGVPIIPVVSEGAHATLYIIDDGRWLAELLRADRYFRVKVWPLALALPWGVMFGPLLLHFPWRTTITTEILEPIRFARSGEEAARDESYVRACADAVEGRMQHTLDRLAAARR